MADLGTDFSCVYDATPDMALASGRTNLAQAIARRYITPRGRLIGAPNYGEDLTQYLNDDLSPGAIARIETIAAAEALKDERVLSCVVRITLENNVMTVNCYLEDAEGPFILVLSISAVNVEILKLP